MGLNQIMNMSSLDIGGSANFTRGGGGQTDTHTPTTYIYIWIGLINVATSFVQIKASTIAEERVI